MRTSTVVRSSHRLLLCKLPLFLLAFVSTIGFPLVGRAATPPSVTLTSSVPSPQKLGNPITFTATVNNAPSGHTYSYQFSVTSNEATQLVSDFSPTPTFTWTPYLAEGDYTFNVIARDTTTVPYALLKPVSVPFELDPWITAPLAAGAIHKTTNPLVAFFNAPPCTVGNQVLVRFHPAAPTGTQNPASMTTNLTPCSDKSANFYIAGMYAKSKYLMHWEEYSGTTLVNTGSDLPFTTGSLPSDFPTNTYTVNVPATAHDAAYPVLMFQAVYPTAVDLSGNVLWYFPNNTGVGLSVSVLALPRMERNGLFYSIPAPTTLQQYNLAGNLVMQTNLEIINEQLVAQGHPMIKQFNSHEVRNLPDGNIGLLGIIDMKSTTAQGGTPAKPVNIEGDMVLVLDHNLHLLWAWNAFDHEDITRAATDGDLTSGGTQDWLHTNALQGTLDGNIILSQRSQDWAIKINYANGTGDGHVIWRMGAGGDFTVTNPPAGSCLDPTSNDASSPGGDNLIPWFDHQHDVHFDFEDQASGDGYMIMTVFDDGNTRHDKCSGTQNSRGMVLLVNEAARQVTYATVADLGAYSLALGSAQLLTPGDGNIYSSFDSGIILPGGLTQVSEVNLAGQIVYQMQSNQETYRAYRMSNLYTPSEFEVAPPAGIQNVLPSNLPFDFSTGFARNQDAVELNGNASISGDALQLTDGGTNEASSVFYNSPVNVQTFTTDFTFQQTSAAADGFTFTIQNASPNALGSIGGSLGYQHIPQSVAVKFDLYSNVGEGMNSTGLFTNGANPTTPSFDLTSSGIDLHSADMMDAHLTYDGTTLTLTLTDLVTKATFTHAFTIDIPGTIGGSTAYVGFTAATGGKTAIQQIMSWSYEPIMVPYQPGGFPSGTTSVVLNGSASLAGSTIELTNGLPNQAASAYFTTPVNVQSFNTDFDFKQTSAAADGFTFVVQNAGLHALGSLGGALGYTHIGTSVAIKFDLFDNGGEGDDSTGIFTNGANPTVPSIDLNSTGINFHGDHMMHAHISYDGNALTLTITDLQTGATFTHPFAVDIPSIVGANTAYVGFTAGTGGSTAIQQILNWTFE